MAPVTAEHTRISMVENHFVLQVRDVFLLLLMKGHRIMRCPFADSYVSPAINASYYNTPIKSLADFVGSKFGDP